MAGSVHEPKPSAESELQRTKECLAIARNNERRACLKAESLVGEIGFLKDELKQAIEAEGKSKAAMDDMVLALRDIAFEANQAKENLSTTQTDLQRAVEETEELKALLQKTGDQYEDLLNESRREIVSLSAATERMKAEAEESALAWNEKEICFISCIKRVEEERADILEVNARLMESIAVSEKKTISSKDDNRRLRDILKQALNEADVAKEAAIIARSENYQLKDCISEKDHELQVLTEENEILRANLAGEDDLESPGSARRRRRMMSPAGSDASEKANSEDFNGLVSHTFEEDDVDKNSRRRKRELLKKFGKMMKNSFHKKEAVVE